MRASDPDAHGARDHDGAARLVSVPLVVLAGGLSTRYGRLKQLDPLGPGGEAIMDYNVYDAARAGFDRMIFVVRPEIKQAVREHVANVVGDTLRLEFVHQDLDELPEGFRTPPDRVRPWGTGHAVLCASRLIHGPFAVCNSDDLYGPGAFSMMYEHLSSDPVPTEAALVGYTLDQTLSGRGGVARGVCVLSRDGLLSRVSEVREIRRIDGWIAGMYTDGSSLDLSGDEIVSMNLWGFTAPIIEHMHRQFACFLGRWGADTSREFFLSTAVNDQIQIRASQVYVLHAPDTWFGVTHAEDRDQAVEILRQRVEEGAYPASLREAFSALDT